jgi:hypothetical protein
MSPRAELLAALYADRPRAHEVLFAHRHPQPSPPFHVEMIKDFHGPAKGVVDFVFRGGAKSTLAEEAIALMAAFREFGNCLVIGENYERAASRLAAIRRELDMNDQFKQAFGDLRGDTWGEDRLVLASGVCIQALGKGQSLRGIKHLDQRPDLVFGDDLENRQDVTTPENRKKVSDWWSFDLRPAMDPFGRWRIAATPLHPESLPETEAKGQGVLVHRYPWYYLDEDGEKRSSWPERFPIEEILATEQDYITRGQLQGFRQEFMCQAEAPELKPFKPDMLRVEPQVQSWQAVYSMTDPARSIRKGSATTGHVVWSWIRSRLIVWDAWGRNILPDEIVAAQFDTYKQFRPTWMGVEEDGLNEFLMQPIRQKQVENGVTLPIRGVKAPIGKIDFIRGLQPFFRANEVIFAKELPDLKTQLLGFPTGVIDVPNALAYALKMRPGAPMYDDFGGRHIAEDLAPMLGSPVWLCLNATSNTVTGMLVQAHNGSLRIFWDIVREGEPALLVHDVIQAAQLAAGVRVKLVAGPQHFEQYGNVGLTQAVRKIPMAVQTGVLPERARGHLRSLLQRERHGMAMFMVGQDAGWTLNALAGGYAREMLKNNVLADYAEDSIYRVLMEGLESFVGLLELGRSTDDDDDASLNASTPDGRRYRSMVRGR